MKAKKAKAPSAQIHDQGYERYKGPRLEQNRRFLIVARNVLTVAWRSLWGFKIPAVLAGLWLMLLGMTMYQTAGMKALPGGEALSNPNEIPLRIIQSSMSPIGMSLFGLLFAALFGCSTVADDLKVGAFQFYFSRSLRTADYVIGKILGVTLLLGVPLFLPPVLLAILRLALVEDSAELGELWTILPLSMAYGALASLVFALPSIGIGALLASRRMAQAAFVAYYVLVGFVASVVAQALKVEKVGLISIVSNIMNVGGAMFEIKPGPNAPPGWQSLIVLIVFCLFGLFGLLWRVSRAEVSSVGGGS